MIDFLNRSLGLDWKFEFDV